MKASPSVTSAHRDVAEILEAASTASNDELLRACQRLASERARYYDLFASSRDACVVTDAKGVIRDANRRAGEALGMAPAALRGKLLIAFVVRGDTREFRNHLASLAELARSGSPLRLRMRARKGSPFRATLWVDGGRRTNDEPISYRWTILGADDASVDASSLDEVLSAVAMLARSMPPGEEGDVASAERTARIGDLVATNIQRMSATAEQRRVRFSVEGGDLQDHVHAAVPRLEQSIGMLLQAALAATPDGSELRIRLGWHEGDTVLDLHVEGVDARSMGSPLSVVHLAAHLAADGGRLEIASPQRTVPPLMRVRWPAAVARVAENGC
jgi:PAS domain S-box-containing protein